MRQVTLYGRPGCHLCEQARALLDRVARDEPFELDERDIERDPALLLRYLERIPVVVIDGVEAFELDELSEPALRECLGRVGGS